MVSIGVYFLALVLGFFLALATGEKGYHLLNQETIHQVAKGLEILVAIAIIPEGYANGFGNGVNHWKSSRVLKLTFWLTLGIVPRAGLLFLAATLLGMENPLAVAGGMLATDPAATAVVLGFMEPQYLASMFWQMAVESQLNDAIGIAVYGLAEGQTLNIALLVVGKTIVGGLILALAQTAVRLLVRRTGSALFELISVLGVYAGALWIGVNEGLSLIGMAAVASISADYFTGRLPEFHEAESHKLHLMWEWLNKVLSAILMFTVVFLTPLVDVSHGEWTAAAVLLTTVIVSRGIVEFGYRGLLRVTTGKWGHRYGLGAGLVNWSAGSTMLGVPSIVALALASHGDTYAASSMLIAVTLSMVIIPLAIVVIQRVEVEHRQA